eukprot:423877-Pelagomonas_calceolata.AAC.1
MREWNFAWACAMDSSTSHAIVGFVRLINRASCERYGGVEKRRCAPKVRHTFDGESRPGDWKI